MHNLKYEAMNDSTLSFVNECPIYLQGVPSQQKYITSSNTLYVLTREMIVGWKAVHSVPSTVLNFDSYAQWTEFQNCVQILFDLLQPIIEIRLNNLYNENSVLDEKGKN